MQLLATLSKPIRNGRISIWEFIVDNNHYYAINNSGREITAKDIKELRNMYKNFIGYGYSL